MRSVGTASAPTLALGEDVDFEDLPPEYATEIDEPVLPGTILSGRYVVGKVFAEGGMGVVCVGRHRELGHLVAIKFLRRDICDRPSIVQRFLNEAKAVAALRGDHVVRVLDIGQLDSGRPFLVMEHLEGEDLDRLVEREGPLPVDLALTYVIEACAALSEAHGKGIIHRDIKPENLFLADVGAGRFSVKVVDFGLAKRIDSSREVGLTGPRESMGSPCYMSPEQITTPQDVDVRTDVWSLGVTLYRLLTGTVPFSGDTMGQIYAHVLNNEPRPIYAVRRGLDSELDAIVRRCLKKDVEHRYQDIAELTEALVLYRRKHVGRRSRVSSSPMAMFVDDAPVELPLKGPRRGWLFGVVLLASLALGVYEADRTGRIDASALAERALGPVLGADGVRRFTDEWLTVPKLELLPDLPVPGTVVSPTTRMPRGVCSLSPAFDSSGRTLSSEAERDVPQAARSQ